MKRLPITYLISAALLLGSSTILAERRVTTRKKLHPSQPPTELPSPWVAPDSLRRCVEFYGYEKRGGASKETLFIKNLSDSALAGIQFTLSYFDNSGRLIHRRSVRQPITIPAGEIRRTDFRSWDTQHSYYYRHGVAPRNESTPYDVTISLDSIQYSTNASH